MTGYGMHEQTFMTLVATSPFKDPAGHSVVCYLVDQNRSVIGYNQPIIDTSDLWLHAEMNAVLKYQQFKFIDEFEVVTAYINRPPCSYCLRTMKFSFPNISIELYTDECIKQFTREARELQVPFRLHKGIKL